MRYQLDRLNSFLEKGHTLGTGYIFCIHTRCNMERKGNISLSQSNNIVCVQSELQQCRMGIQKKSLNY